MKKILLVLLTIFIFSGKIFAQEPERMSIHQEQILKHSSKEKIASKFDLSGKGIIPLQKSQSKALSKVVFGFLPDWEYNSGAHNNMRYDLLSHLAVFNFLADSDGNLSNPSSWPWTDVINAGHSNGTKIIMSVTNFGGSEGAVAVAEKIMTDATSKANFFNNIKTIITTYQLDGVNIDFEGLTTDLRGDILNNFMKELTTYIHTNLPGKEVSFDGPAVNWGGWKLKTLTENVDHLFIMAYDYNGGFSDFSGPVSPLVHPVSWQKSVTHSLDNYYKEAITAYPERIVLGVPYYGKHWKTVSGDSGAAVDPNKETGYVGSTFYRDDVLEAPTKGGIIWEDDYMSPRYKWQEGSQWHQIWTESEKSLGMKYDLAIARAIGGVGIWALNYDSGRTELWNLINTKFASGSGTIPSTPRSAAAIRKDATTITVVFQAGNDATSYEVLQSTNNIDFSVVKEDSSLAIDITGLTQGEVYYFKVRSKNSTGVSTETEVIAAMPSVNKSEFLIIDGLSRRDFDAITQYDIPMTQLGRSFSNASADAVINGIVNLKNYNFVIWMLLDESSSQDTFNKEEQTKVKEYIDANGVFIVSGSEVGWDLIAKGDAQDIAFYENYLKAEYIEDAPANTKDTYYTVKDTGNKKYVFDDGSHGILNISWPDEIKAKNGSSTSFTYDGYTGSGVAGVSYQNGTGGVEYMAFPIEAIYNDTERKDLLDYLFSKYSSLLSVDDSFIKSNIALYPNPTNGLLKISNPNFVEINTVDVYNIYGQKLKADFQNNTINISNFTAGIYLVRIEDIEGKQGTFKIIKN